MTAPRVAGRGVETETKASAADILTWWRMTQDVLPKRRLTWRQRLCRHTKTRLSVPVRIRWAGDEEWFTAPRVVICERCNAVLREASDA